MIRIFASYLGKYPSVKRTLKYIFQIMMFAFSYHRTKLFCKFKLNRITDERGGFFGYYDKSPESPDGRYVIYHSPTVKLRKRNFSEIEIILIDRQKESRKTVATSKASNLQIGSRLQWLDNSRFIFNYYDEELNDYFSRIYNVMNDVFVEAGPAIYDTHGDDYITTSFKTLADINSEYGYYSHNGSFSDEPCVLTGKFGRGAPQCIISLEDLKNLYPSAFIKSEKHHFNHLMFAPSGNAFIVIFRWSGKNGRNELLLHHRLQDNHTTILNDEMTSHCCWVDDNRVLGYMKYKGADSYYYISLVDNISSRMPVDTKLKDGHPTVKNGIVLCDTYPDFRRMQHIYLVDKGVQLEVGSFFSPIKFHERDRCDLHPRFNKTGNRIYFDSMHGGIRHLYRIKFGDDE